MQEAVNTLIQSVGHSPVSTIPTSGLEIPNIAENVLKATSRTVQNVGLWCNTETNFKLLRQADGTVKVPSNVLDITFASTSENEYVLRGQYVYDRLQHTNKHTGDLVATEIIFLLGFTDLPAYIREYIVRKSGREFQLTQKPDTIRFKFTYELEQEAYVVMKDKEDEKTPTNLLQATDVYDIAHQYRR
jgi:hypothetical protein